MAEFFIETAESSNGEHIIHFSSCEALPPQTDLKYLGSIASFDSARIEGKKTFYKVNACTTCAGKHAEQ